MKTYSQHSPEYENEGFGLASVFFLLFAHVLWEFILMLFLQIPLMAEGCFSFPSTEKYTLIDIKIHFI